MKKKLTAIVMALVLLFSCIPVSTYAAESEEVCAAPYNDKASLIEVTRQGAPIRTGPGERYSTVTTCPTGTVLEKTGSKLSRALNQFYEVTYRDNYGNCYSGYIFSENTTKHSHEFEKIEYEGLTYKVCDCGKITVRVKTEYRLKKADAVAVAGAAAGTLAAADGPVPLGDLLGAGLLVTVGIMNDIGIIPDADEIQAVYEDIDLDQLNDDDDSCPIDSYRKVSRKNGPLEFVGNDCMSIIEAYGHVRSGQDVWCRDYPTAHKLASLCKKGCFSEIDSGNKDYWYHFHLGTCTPEGKHLDVVGGHIFWGTSAITHSLPH